MSDKHALDYHRFPVPGKLAIAATKPLATQQDLALAYSPGVAAACNAIVEAPPEAANLTARSNLVAVITNGTAVLGLGAIGPLAAKPVMEGKAVLFKKFAGIDVFDIEVDETDPAQFVETVARLEPTFGGINLEDIRAPECFEIEAALRARMRIPVFHDDQHGTAIIVGAAIANGLELAGKVLSEVKVVVSGAGAAALACLDMLMSMGLERENTWVSDRHGVVYQGRAEMDPWRSRYARETGARTLADVIDGADIFLGLSAPGVLSPELVRRMAQRPLILALANPEPEIRPEAVHEVRPDALIATGRSDYPNQVNNVLCFPFIFRGALDSGATEINEEMKLACVSALAELAKAEPAPEVARAYGGELLSFGPDMLIPKPFDPRLLEKLAAAVADAAMRSGVATRPIEDFDAYRLRLSNFVYRSGFIMKPVFDLAIRSPQRLVYAEGEERRVLQAAQQVIDQGIARPILIGRANVMLNRIRELGLRMRDGEDFDLVNILKDRRFRQYWGEYHRVMGRRGISPELAKSVVRSQPSAVAALMLRIADADAMLCGAIGPFNEHLRQVRELIGCKEGIRDLSALTVLLLPSGTFFICDTHVTPEPSAEELAETALLAAAEARAFGFSPKVALLSRSNFGTCDSVYSRRAARAVELLHARAPELEVDGEMHGDAALSESIRKAVLPDTRLRGQANVLVMPNVEAAHIAYNMLKVLGGGITIGPILLGAARSAHVVTQSITVRGLVNMSALACARAKAGAPGHAPFVAPVDAS